MSKLRHVYNREIKEWLGVIVREAALANYKPAAIIAPNRGGLGLGAMLSHYYDCPLFPLELSTRDHVIEDVNLVTNTKYSLCRATLKGPILFIDDINDSGKTLGKLKDIVNSLAADDTIIKDIRYAVLLEKYTSSHEADFVGSYIDEQDNGQWVVFPWEDWWHRA
jgi:hypoxanthine phosphoribosyltransferase